MITLATESDRPRLMQVWEASVRATHHFLSEQDLVVIIPAAREELAHITPIHCLRDPAGSVYSFMAVENARIEMLFVDPTRRGGGAGRRLVEYAITTLGARQVDVNEQNELAVGFYQRLGFRTLDRSALDPQGLPLPILHMELSALQR